MLTRILLGALLIVLVVRAIGRLLRGIAEGAGSARTARGGPGRAPRGGAGRPASPAKGELMVKDPVCGTYVVQSRALSARGKDGVEHFCSDKCRQAYLSR